jgi:small subunit ribosomal protein S4
MARYTGPKSKISRKFGEAILGPSKALAKKNYPPGQHGKGRRSKKSEYALQLLEKQKMKYTYGILERQFENLFHKAAAKDGITGENLIKFCEARLDNTVYRLGIAPTRRAARQLVIHKHIVIDGEVVNIPSYSLKGGQVIGVRENLLKLFQIVYLAKCRADSTGLNGIALLYLVNLFLTQKETKFLRTSTSKLSSSCTQNKIVIESLLL